MKKNCKYCNKEFHTTYHHHVVFCSHLCANRASAFIRRRRVKIKCEYCKKNFEVTKGDLKYRKVVKFCSTKCYRLSIETKQIKCEYCKKKFKPNRNSQKICSISCVSKRRKGTKLSKKTIEKVKAGMAKPEVKKKLSMLNRRSRKPMTESHKQKISNKLAGRTPKNNSTPNKYGHIKSGKYDINGKIIFFRSKWEANYALYLDFLVKQKEIEKWEYEADTFIFHMITLGTRSYKPDFKIFQNDKKIVYHEVKGYMDKISKIKLKRMKKYYPEIPIILIDAKVYKSIQILSKVLKFY